MISSSYRVALYSPGMVGLGHFRRNLLIAQALSASLQPVILLLAEAHEAAAFALPTGVDCLTLPALRKTYEGTSAPRRLNLALDQVVALRAAVIRAALERFAPHVLIVDHLPRGAFRELDGALEMLRDRGQTRCVLGLRDVLETPETVRREWARAESPEAILGFYDAVWIYGDPSVYDPIREYDFAPEIAVKVRYTGYLDQRLHLGENGGALAVLDDLDLQDRPLMLCVVGGGQDGDEVAEAFAKTALPRNALGLILTGPFMPTATQKRLAAYAAKRRDLRVIGFVPEPGPLLQRADRIVAMGGYNTICEILSYEKPALVVPRNGARAEQTIRARRLQALGLLDVLDRTDLTPGAIGAWLQSGRSSPPARGATDLGGLDRVVALLTELIGQSEPEVHPAPVPR